MIEIHDYDLVIRKGLEYRCSIHGNIGGNVLYLASTDTRVCVICLAEALENKLGSVVILEG